MKKTKEPIVYTIHGAYGGKMWTNETDVTIPMELRWVQEHWIRLQRSWVWSEQRKEAIAGNPNAYVEGTCVLGAGFQFDYAGKTWFMDPGGPYQGSLPWEYTRDEIEELLRRMGAKNLSYEWGRMD